MRGKLTIAIVIALFGIAIYLFAKTPYLRYRVSGLWDLEWSVAEWRFDWDGTFVEESIINTKGTYEFPDWDTVRINMPLGSQTYKITFENNQLILGPHRMKRKG